MKKITRFKKIMSIAGIFFGFVSIIMGSNVSDMSIGDYELNITYGGDAYTGMQNAAAQTANNVQCLADIVRTGTSCILVILGWAMIFYFALKFVSLIEKKNNIPLEEQNQTKTASSSQNNTSSADELKKYKELLDNGVITQEEFDEKKKQLLNL